MNQSDLHALRQRLQSRQAQAYPTEPLDVLGGVALALFFLFILFI